MTISLRTLVRQLPFALPRSVDRWCNTDLSWSVDPILAKRMADEIATATFVQRLQEQGVEV